MEWIEYSLGEIVAINKFSESIHPDSKLILSSLKEDLDWLKKEIKEAEEHTNRMREVKGEADVILSDFSQFLDMRPHKRYPVNLVINVFKEKFKDFSDKINSFKTHKERP